MAKRRSRPTKPSIDRYRVTDRAPTTAALAERARPPTDERGTSGGVSFGGILSGFDADYADAWRLPKRWDTTERMRTDPAVSACLAALTYPVLAATFTAEAASDDPEDQRLAEFVDQSLAGMSVALARHRMEALAFVAEGVRVFETVYEQREDGYWWLRKLALRPNKTITTWHVDDNGGPDGVSQTTTTGRPEKLDMDRLLALTYLGDGPSLIGRPATRAMYRPWFLIDKLSRIGAISLERHGVGIPWARYVGGSDTEAKRIDRALMGLHANEQAFFRVDDQVTDWGVKGVEGTVMDPVPFMEYQRRDLFLAALAQFLVLGTDGVGAQALSSDHSGLFMLVERFITTEIEDSYSDYLVPRMIGYNWSVPADRLPRLKHGVIDQRNATEWATAVAQVVAAGVQLPGDELSRTAARLLGLTVPEKPDLPAPDVADVNDPNAPEVGGGGRAVQNATRSWTSVDLATGASGLQSPAMIEALGIRVDFARMSSGMDRGRDRIVERLRPLQEKAARRTAQEAAKLAREADPGALAEGLRGLEVPTADEEAALLDELQVVYGLGVDSYTGELEAQGVTVADAEAEARKHQEGLLAAVAIGFGSGLGERMRQAAIAAVLQAAVTGQVDKDALALVIVGASDSLLGQIGLQAVALALSLGRRLIADSNAQRIGWEIYTAVMDSSSCRPCRELDGRRFAVGEGPACPNPSCLGGSRCRCIRIPVAHGRSGG